MLGLRLWNHPEVRITAGADQERFRRNVERLWDPGYVADILLRDGTTTSAVLIGISKTALILDRWDSSRGQPSGDPFTLAIWLVAEIAIP